MLNLDLICKGHSQNKPSVTRPSSDFALATIGDIKMVATRTTPCISVAEDEQQITLALLYAGDRYRYQKDDAVQHIEPGSIHLCQRTGGTAYLGYFSGIICEIDRLRLQRTMRAMGVEPFTWNPAMSYVLRKATRRHGCISHRHLWSLFSFVDELLAESTYLAAGLGLDEQLYRLLALSLFQQEGILDKVPKLCGVSATHWTPPLDDLVDYIRTHAHLNLSLTDLEEQTHYSGRHLQNLFREKFNCTPMQFVKRQRLTAAHERLQAAADDATVTDIARDCGYRFTSNFSTDFHREFGVPPSVVLRASRCAAGS